MTGFTPEQDAAIRDILADLVDDAVGIVTAVPAAVTSGGEIWANIVRMWERLAPVVAEPRPARLDVGFAALDALRLQLPPADPPPFWPAGIVGLLGIPIVVDEGLPPDGWRLVDRDGNVLHEGWGVSL